ncbi:MAG: hypothetical protein M3O99_07810 [Chloroflexota bacterium]|nr:hypothetical protein [Chloroflexota bacterium]
MDTSKLARLGGVAAALGGLMLVLYNATELALFTGAPLSDLSTRPGWVPFQVIGVFGSVVIVLGLIALYSRQAERAGWLGLVGFVVSLAGALGYSGASWAAAYIVPPVSRVAPSIVDGPDQLVGAGLISTILLAAVGWILFGIATIRAGVFPRWTGILIIVANVMPFILQPFGIPTQISPIALGVAMIGMGYQILSSDLVPVRVPVHA